MAVTVAGERPGHRRMYRVKRSKIERKLKDLATELRRLREDLHVSTEQLEHLTMEAEEARIRALVSETPLAEQEHNASAAHAERMRMHHDEIGRRIAELEQRQDQLLDEMTA